MAWFRRKDGEGAAGGKKVVIAEGLWIKCDSCKEIVYRAEVERAGRVCPKCRYAFRIGARERVAALVDAGSFEERDAGLVSADPLAFGDTKRYRDRVRLIGRRTRGFVYLVSLTGVTGERAHLPEDLEAQVRALRLVTTKPVCVGFGISRPEHAATVGRIADGVIVGSAIVRLVEERAGAPSLVTDVGDFIASLKEPLRDLGATPTSR